MLVMMMLVMMLMLRMRNIIIMMMMMMLVMSRCQHPPPKHPGCVQAPVQYCCTLYVYSTVQYCTVLYTGPPELCMPPEESEELHDKRTRARVRARARARIMRARNRRPGTPRMMPCAPLTDPTPDSLVPLGLYRASYSLA